MKNFEIIATSTGHSFGIYEAENAEAAVQAMLADAGHDGPADGDIVAVDGLADAIADAIED